MRAEGEMACLQPYLRHAFGTVGGAGV